MSTALVCARTHTRTHARTDARRSPAPIAPVRAQVAVVVIESLIIVGAIAWWVYQRGAANRQAEADDNERAARQYDRYNRNDRYVDEFDGYGGGGGRDRFRSVACHAPQMASSSAPSAVATFK